MIPLTVARKVLERIVNTLRKYFVAMVLARNLLFR